MHACKLGRMIEQVHIKQHDDQHSKQQWSWYVCRLSMYWYAKHADKMLKHTMLLLSCGTRCTAFFVWRDTASEPKQAANNCFMICMLHLFVL